MLHAGWMWCNCLVTRCLNDDYEHSMARCADAKSTLQMTFNLSLPRIDDWRQEEGDV